VGAPMVIRARTGDAADELMHGPARQTIAYFGGHVALGLMSAVLGPTLPGLAAQVAEDPEALGILFAVRSLGYLLASMTAGPIYDRRPGHPILVAALLVLAVGLAAVPLAPTRIALIGLLGLLGLAQGVLDVGNNILLTRVHGLRVAPYMSALHGAYGVGALLAPLVIGASGSLGSGYAWLAVAMLPAAGWVLATPSPALDRTGAEPHPRPAREREAPSPGQRRLVALLVLWFLLCVGAEAGFAGWLFTIAQATGLTEADGNGLVSGFWAAFTLGRLLAIVAAVRVRPERLLLGDLVGAIVCVAVLLAVPGPTGLIVGSLGLGLSLASVFPASMSLAAARLRLDGSLTSALFVGASLGSMLVPWALGYTLAYGPSALLWALLADLALAAVVFAGLARSNGATLRGRGRAHE
jgi:MFS transporter, FHS family, Na+ dependent glucose transporter 1